MRTLQSLLHLLRLPIAGLCLIATAGLVQAAVEADVVKTIEQAFKQVRPEWRIASVEATPLEGMYKVQISNGPHVYATAQGEFFITGDLYQVTGNGFVNLAEQQRESERAQQLAALNTDDMIVFSPKDQPAKASIMVFTDVDCYYCQKLHQEMADLNRLGIEVRYLAFPRAGIGSESYKKIASAWCAKDQQNAMTRLKNRQPIPINVCADNPVANQYQLGQQVGVTGTPALVTADGRLMPGYMPAVQLARALGVKVDPAVAAELQAAAQ